MSQPSGTGTQPGALVLPAGLRLPQVQLLLGVELDRIDWSVLEWIVRERLPEHQSLEFKGELYRNRQEELAKDSAGMANASGGLIIVGIAEDDSGRADRLTNLPLNDQDRRQMLEAIGRIEPLTPDLTVVPIPATHDPVRGAYLIFVPASTVAPHGVWNATRTGYSWPIREDTRTRWMREPEISRRYRDRFSAAKGQIDRLDDTWRTGKAGCDHRLSGWIAVAVAPDRAGGALRIDRDAVQRSRSWLSESLLLLPDQGVIAPDSASLVGRRKLIHSSAYTYSGLSDQWHIELHLDGASFAGVRLIGDDGDFRGRRERFGNASSVTPIMALDIDAWLVRLLGLLSQHAIRSGAGGDLAVRASLLTSGLGSTLITEASDPSDVSTDQRMVPGSVAVGLPTRAEQTVSMSVATNPADLVAAAASLSLDVLSEFNVSESPALKSNGSLRESAIRLTGMSALRSWGVANGLIVAEE